MFVNNDYLILKNSKKNHGVIATWSIPAQFLDLSSFSPISSSYSQTLGTSSLSLSTASSSKFPFVYCGRGDKKTERGKRFNHSFGNARPRGKPVPPSPPRKDKFDDDEKIMIEID